MRKKKPTEDLWNGLAEVGTRSLPAWWRARCGPEGFALLERFLKATTETATWFPDPDDHTHHMDVGAHPVKDGKFLAKATAEGDAREIILEKSDVTIHRLDIAAFGKAVAKALGLSILKMPQPIGENVIKLGNMPSHGLVLYLVVPSHESDFSTAFAKIRLRESSFLAILTPTRHSLTAEFRQLEDSGVAQHAALCDLLAISGSEYSLIVSLSDYLSPAKDAPGGPPYAKWPYNGPARAQWGHVEIVFKSIDQLWIKFGDSQGNFRASDIQGFTAKTNGKPTTQYNLLLLLGIKGGTLKVPSNPKSQSTLRQARNRLKAILCNFFGIEAKFHKDIGKKWACLFHVRWDGPDDQRDRLICHAENGDAEDMDSEVIVSEWDNIVGVAFSSSSDPMKKARFTA